MKRSTLREIIMKLLYEIYIYEGSKISYDIDDLISEQLEVPNDFVKESLDGILQNEKEITTLANSNLKDWSVDRISKVDKAILSLAIYELKYTDTPEKVVINEAIELSKKYSDEKVTKMINACLDSIYKSIEK